MRIRTERGRIGWGCRQVSVGECFIILDHTREEYERDDMFKPSLSWKIYNCSTGSVETLTILFHGDDVHQANDYLKDFSKKI